MGEVQDACSPSARSAVLKKIENGGLSGEESHLLDPLTDLLSFTHLVWKSRILLVLHAQIFHTFFISSRNFCFSYSPYISVKLRQLQLRFTHFTYSNLAAML